MSMNVRSYTKLRQGAAAGLVFLGLVMTCCLRLAGAEPAPAAKPEKAAAKPEKKETEEKEEKTDLVNSIGFSVGGAIVDGPRSQFQRRYRIGGDRPYGGLDELHLEKEISKTGVLKVDGQALIGNYDYSMKLEISEPDTGYVRAGYRQFRTWSDGTGGFDPLTAAWFPLADQVLHLDRGEAWIEAGLTLPDWPKLKLRYSHQFRDGTKDSTIWGQAAGMAVPGGRLGITSSFWDIDEDRDIIQGDLSHKLGKTDLGVGLRYEIDRLNNGLHLNQQYKAGTITQREGQRTTEFSAHAFTETRFNDKILLTSGYSYTTLDTDLSGSRVFEPTVPTTPLAGFLGLTGGSALREYVFTLNLQAMPWDNFTIVPSIRAQKQDVNGMSLFANTYPVGPPEDLSAQNENDYLEVSGRLEARYTGLTNWVFYARGDWVQGDGDQVERQIALATGALQLLRDTDYTRFTQQYTAGLNWYPVRKLNLSGQYYHKTRENDYNHLTSFSTLGGLYPAFLQAQDFETDDLNIRINWRPLNTVTLVSRYDYQVSTVDTLGTGLSTIESGNLKSHIFSESLTWSPLNRLYLQGGLNYALNELSTPASDLNSTLVQKSENDYWTATFSAGLALDQKTDLRAQYLYSRADNYLINSTVSQPYGAGFEEHGVTMTLVRMLRKSVRWTLQYGYSSFRDQAAQGRNDFNAHLIYSGLLYRF